PARSIKQVIRRHGSLLVQVSIAQLVLVIERARLRQVEPGDGVAHCSGVALLRGAWHVYGDNPQSLAFPPVAQLRNMSQIGLGDFRIDGPEMNEHGPASGLRSIRRRLV